MRFCANIPRSRSITGTRGALTIEHAAETAGIDARAAGALCESDAESRRLIRWMGPRAQSQWRQRGIGAGPPAVGKLGAWRRLLDTTCLVASSTTATAAESDTRLVNMNHLAGADRHNDPGRRVLAQLQPAATAPDRTVLRGLERNLFTVVFEQVARART